jgi:uncharacterized protein YyaL (SSP411 family)
MKTPLLPLALLLALAAAAAAADVPWLTSLEEAQAQARRENKLVFVNFTGSDWCPPCIRMKKEVFPSAEFQAFARSNLVLVELDFPQRRSLPAAQQAYNDRLAKQHGIEGFPTLLILTPDGKKAGGHVGFRPGKGLLADLRKLRPKP